MMGSILPIIVAAPALAALILLGVPARLVGFVCACGARLEVDVQGCGHCARCGRTVEIGAETK